MSGGSHIGRAWSGHEVEDMCPCPQEPCGLISDSSIDPRCDDHSWTAGRSLRQGHPAALCPGA